ncbi:MAG: hypothetical protein M1476_03770, partial [Candidatus Thermoplasmatota archaeon]|nr:hypothetical protein [Candidatus Thermoplasmatota archaeon]
MQKLDRRDTYTPMDAPQGRGNCDHALNRDRSLSVHGLETPSNNPDADLRGNAVRTGDESLCPSFLQIFFRFIPNLTDGVSSGGI